jgi:hypothetical protein
LNNPLLGQKRNQGPLVLETSDFGCVPSPGPLKKTLGCIALKISSSAFIIPQFFFLSREEKLVSIIGIEEYRALI